MKYLKYYESISEIDRICKEYDIENYTINADGTIDVNGGVDLSKKGLTELPLKFNYVDDDFHCYDNKLTSLLGCPKSVGGNFDCCDNKLTSLEDAPESVGFEFDCSGNELTTLKGAPESVNGSFYCHNNKLTDLKGAPESVYDTFNCNRNHLTSLEGATKSVGYSFNCNRNHLTSLEGAPESVGGNFNCSDNKNLTSLEGAPIRIGKEFNCKKTPVYEIWILFKDKDKLGMFNDFYDPIRDNSTISLFRLNEFLEDIGKPPVESVKGYTMI